MNNIIFNKIAKEYRNIHDENLKITGLNSEYFAKMKIIKIKSNLNKSTNLNILEVGCGDGKLAEYIKKYFIDYNYTGLDISNEEIDIANNKNISNSKFILYDGINFPFEIDSFDIIILAQVLHHVENYNNILKQCHKVLKKDGHLFIFEHNPINPFTQYIVKTCVFDKDAKLINHKNMKKSLINNNFFIENFEFITFFPNKLFFKYLIPFERYLKKFFLGGQYYIKIKKT